MDIKVFRNDPTPYWMVRIQNTREVIDVTFDTETEARDFALRFVLEAFGR